MPVMPVITATRAGTHFCHAARRMLAMGVHSIEQVQSFGLYTAGLTRWQPVALFGVQQSCSEHLLSACDHEDSRHVILSHTRRALQARGKGSACCCPENLAEHMAISERLMNRHVTYQAMIDYRHQGELESIKAYPHVMTPAWIRAEGGMASLENALALHDGYHQSDLGHEPNRAGSSGASTSERSKGWGTGGELVSLSDLQFSRIIGEVGLFPLHHDGPASES